MFIIFIKHFFFTAVLPLQTSMCYPSSVSVLAPGYSPWDDTSQLISPSGGIMTSQDEYDLHGIEGMFVIYRFSDIYCCVYDIKFFRHLILNHIPFLSRCWIKRRGKD